MQPNAVKLPVIASVPLDCTFWPEDDGWTGECTEFSVRVRGGNFEEAKKHMEADLQTYIEIDSPSPKNRRLSYFGGGA